MNKLYVTLMSCLILSSIPTLAKADRAGGGGDAGKSTPTQIEAVLKKIRSPLGSIFYAGGARSLRGESKDLENVFDKIIPHGSWTFEDMEIGKDIGYDNGKTYNGKPFPGSPFILKTDGPCRDLDGSEKDAAVTAPTPLTPICFSIPRLMNIPPESLERRILALAAHEFVHHYNNFGEVEAQMVQIYILEHYEELTHKDGFRMSLGRAMDDLSSASGELIAFNHRNKSLEAYCEYVGRFEMATVNASVMIRNYGFENKNNESVAYDLLGRASGLANYCGSLGTSWGSGQVSDVVKYKDEVALKQKAQEFFKIEQQLQIKVKKEIGLENYYQ